MLENNDLFIVKVSYIFGIIYEHTYILNFS